jgi:hypothetical protein
MGACGEDVDEGAAAQHEGMRQVKVAGAEAVLALGVALLSANLV